MTRPADLIHELAQRLAEAGFPSPGADARLLVAHAAGESPGALLAKWELEPDVVRRATQLVDERMTGTPVQHITGEAFFRHETLHVGPGVFIPRPETESLVDLAIKILTGMPSRRVVELCAGSGAISRSLAREVADVELHVNERSGQAAEYLRKNLADVQATIEIADMAVAFPALGATVDVVVVNPPYIPEKARAVLPNDVLDHDPDEALFAGPDGLAAMPTVIATARRLLRDGGHVVIEHDESHQDGLMAMLEADAFEDVAGHRDLAGRPRFVSARRAARSRRPGLPRVGV